MWARVKRAETGWYRDRALPRIDGEPTRVPAPRSVFTDRPDESDWVPQARFVALVISAPPVEFESFLLPSPPSSRGRRAGDEGAAPSKIRSRPRGARVGMRGYVRRFGPDRQRYADCPLTPDPSPPEAGGEGRKNGSQMSVFGRRGESHEGKAGKAGRRNSRLCTALSVATRCAFLSERAWAHVVSAYPGSGLMAVQYGPCAELSQWAGGMVSAILWT